MNSQLLCAVIDDDKDFVDRVKRFFHLSRPGYELVTFESSADALNFIRQHRVDLILTAYLVSPIDGLHLTHVVRSINPRVPIVMLSNYPVEAAALARGATAFLTKGKLWTHLESLIRSMRDVVPIGQPVIVG